MPESSLREAAISLHTRPMRRNTAMSASVMQRDGTVLNYTSSSGILNMNAPVYASEWDPAVCFFSLISDNIRLELI